MTSSSERYLPGQWTLPELTNENRAFFTSGKVVVERCRNCGTVQHPAVGLCHACQEFDLEVVPASPQGVVESVTIVHHSVHELLNAAVPYNVVVVSLEDYPEVRVVGNVVHAQPGEVHIGARVTATWAIVPAEEDRDEMQLLQWELSR